MADSTGDPELDQWAGNRTSPYLNQLLKAGIPPNVAEYMLSQPSFAEGERPHPEAQWVRPYGPEVPGTSPAGEAYERWLRDALRQRPPGAQGISYQPGATPAGMGADLKAAGEPAQPDLTQQYRAMIANGVPPNVALNILIKPSYAEDASPRGGWPYSYAGSENETLSRLEPQRDTPLNQRMLWQEQPSAGRNISYQPGGNLSPQTLQALQYYLGGGGQQGDPLSRLVGQLYGLGSDQSQYQRSTPTPPWPQNAPYLWDMYSGQRGGPPVDFSYPPVRPMLPANNALLSQNPPSYG